MAASPVLPPSLADYGRVPEVLAGSQVVAFFHLAEADLRLVNRQVTPANRLGLALQLGCVRLLGSFVTDLASVPSNALGYVCEQLDIADPRIVSGYGGGARASRHRALIRRHEGLRDLSDPDVALRLVRWLASRVWTRDERPELLFELAAARLRESKVLLPGASTLERLLLRVRDRMETRLHRQLVALVIRRLIIPPTASAECTP